MNRAVNAVLLGLAAFVLMAAFVWVLFVETEPPASAQESTESPTTSSTAPNSTSPSTSGSSSSSSPSSSTSSSTPPPSNTSTTSPHKPPKNTSDAAAPEFQAHQSQADASNPLAEAALHFIAGGLIVLGLVFFLVFAGQLVRLGDPGGAPREVRLPRAAPTPDLDAKQQKRKPREGPVGPHPEEARREIAQPADLDIALGHFRDQQPRVIRTAEEWLQIRLYDCAECRNARNHGGCAETAKQLEGAVEQVWRRPYKVKETACRGHGAPVCEFEVGV